MSREFATSVSLSSVVSEAQAVPGAPLVIALHGWGMSEASFSRWLRPGIDHVEALSWWIPRGILPGQVRSKKVGYGWYVFDGKNQDALKTSMGEARAYLAELAGMARRYLDCGPITLAGFSQGGYVASYAALTRPDLFSGLVCCGGRPKAEFVDDLAPARSMRVLIQTGLRDEAVSPELMAKGAEPLKRAGLDVIERSYDAEHRLTREMAVDIAEFAR